MGSRWWLVLMAVFLVAGCLGGGSAPPMFTLTVEVHGEGTVVPSEGEHPYAKGSIVSIAAEPEPGWVFSHWIGDVAETVPGMGQTVVDQDKTVTAVFVQAYALAVTHDLALGPMLFAGGIKLDFSAASAGDGATIAVDDVSSQLVLPAGMQLAGAAIAVFLDGQMLDLTAGVAIELPLDPGVDASAIGVFRQSGDDWLYQPSQVDNNHVRTVVNAFSVYAVLTAEQVATPSATPSTDALAAGEEIVLGSGTAGAAVFLSTTGDVWPGDFSLYQAPLLMPTSDFSFYAIAYKANMLPSPVGFFAYTVDEVELFQLHVDVVGEGTVSQEALVHPTAFYRDGNAVQLTAVPAQGWSFVRWEGDLDGDENPTELIMDGDKQVTAVFTTDGPTYTISGTLQLDDGSPLVHAVVDFSGGYGSVLTDADGHFEKSGLRHPVMVTPVVDSVSFTPHQIAVAGPRIDCDFVGIAGFSMTFQPEARNLGRTQMEQITDVSENHITFSESTTFAVGDILIVNDQVGAGTGIPEGGLLRRVTGVADHGRELITEDALLEDVVQHGRIQFGESYPVAAVSQAIMPAGQGVVAYDVLQQHVEIDVDLGNHVQVVGVLALKIDLDLAGDMSFSEGLRHFEFAVSSELEVDLALVAGADVVGLENELVLAYWTGPAIFVFPGVFLVPRLDFVVGAVCEVTAGVEVGIHYTRSIRVGLAYDQGDWSTISELDGDGFAVQQPELQGSAMAEAYAGVKLSGRLYDAIGLSTGSYLYGDAEANVNLDIEDWQWDYRLGLGMKLAAVAELSVLRIASLSVTLAEGRLFHTNVAYGVSGRVLDALGNPIAGAEIAFDGNDVVVSDADGFWTKHLLSGEVEVTASAEGYDFPDDPLVVTEPTSEVVFTATYGISGWVYDEDQLPVSGVRIFFGDAADPVYTNSAGEWEQSGFAGTVVVTADKEGYFFHPPLRELFGPSQAADFISGDAIPGTRIGHSAAGSFFYMRLAPAASYRKGSEQFPVTAHVDAPFWIAETEVTYSLWYGVRVWAEARGYVFQFLGWEGHHGLLFEEEQRPNGAPPSAGVPLPVTRISFYDIAVWCNALSELKGLPSVYWYGGEELRDATSVSQGWDIEMLPVNGFRVPMQDEWELAARYQGSDSSHGAQEWDGVFWTPRDYASGGTAVANDANMGRTMEVAWFLNNSFAPGSLLRTNWPVGLKRSNYLGLYDMSGNVSEWCFDFSIYAGGDSRVARGGAMDSRVDRVRNQSTIWYGGKFSSNTIGFRLARSPLMIE